MLTRVRIPLVLVLAAALVFSAAPSRAKTPPAPVTEKAMGTLVTTEWLSEHLGEPDLVVLDCTIRLELQEGGGFKAASGRDAYMKGHIPTAAFADLKDELSDTDSPLAFALPSPEAFCDAMGKLGVGDRTRVVVYDRMMSVWAARVWWMLRWAGFDRAAVLDGGWGAWSGEERPQSTEPANYRPQKLTPRPRPQLVADRDEVFSALEDDGVTIVDAMPAAHYRGEMALYSRPGHIPGAVNIPSTELLDNDGRFKPLEELLAVFTGDPNARYIVYCGSGISASGDAFAMTRLGFTNVAVYTASLQEWAANEANPLVAEGK